MRNKIFFAMMIEVRTTRGGIKLNQQYAEYIDHTLLKADAKKEEIIQLCEEANTYSFASVCVNPAWVKTASEVFERINCKSLYCYRFSFRSIDKRSKGF